MLLPCTCPKACEPGDFLTDSKHMQGTLHQLPAAAIPCTSSPQERQAPTMLQRRHTVALTSRRHPVGTLLTAALSPGLHNSCIAVLAATHSALHPRRTAWQVSHKMLACVIKSHLHQDPIDVSQRTPSACNSSPDASLLSGALLSVATHRANSGCLPPPIVPHASWCWQGA